EILERRVPGELSAAADLCERRRMWREAAQLRERSGEPAAARELFARGGLLLEAARIDERLGKLREAGMDCEQLLATDPPARAAAGICWPGVTAWCGCSGPAPWVASTWRATASPTRRWR